MNNSTLTFRISCLVLCTWVLTLVGCSTTDEETKIEPKFSSLWDNKFSSCGVVCHTPSDVANGTADGPDLTTMAKFYANVVNKSVSDDYAAWIAVRTSTCNDQKIVEPSNANNSTLAASLIESVHNTLKTTCTSAYNYHASNKATITDQALADALVEWINNGAQNN